MSIYMSRDSSMSTLAPDLVNANPEDLSNEDLLRDTDLLKASNKYLAIENQVIEMYLKQMDPELLTGMYSSQITLQSLPWGASPMPSRRGTEDVSGSSHFHPTVRTSTQVSTSILEKGPRINLSNKDDIVSRETDELKAALDKLHVRSAGQRASLKAKIEETQVTLQETLEAQGNLEFVEQAVDAITGRIPAEKFMRHLEEWLKRADLMVEKLRLRTFTLRTTNIRLQQILEQKEELGENLSLVDFEQLQIENKRFLEKIEQKNRHLLELKKMAGSCNLQMTVQKKKMKEQMMELAELQEELADLENKGKEFDKAADIVEAEAAQAEDKYTAVKDFMTNYTAPDVLDYIKKIAEVYDLQQAVKVWSRRKKIQQIALTACKKVLHNLKQTSTNDTKLSRPHSSPRW